MWEFLACRWLSCTGAQAPPILWFHYPPRAAARRQGKEEEREHTCFFTTVACVLVRDFSGEQSPGQVIRKTGPRPGNPIDTL